MQICNSAQPGHWFGLVTRLDQPKKQTSNIIGFLVYLVYGFSEKQKMFSCVLHTANSLTCFERFF